MDDHEMPQRPVEGENIIEAGARPKGSRKLREASIFNTLKDFVAGKINCAVDIAETAGKGIANRKDAEAQKTYAEARKTIEEASRIAVKKEGELSRERLDSLIKKNEIIDDIFRSNQEPLAIKMKLANLLRYDADIIMAVEDVQDWIDKHSCSDGCMIQFPKDRMLSDNGESQGAK